MEVSNLQSWAGLDTVKLWEGTCPIGWLEGFRRTESTIGGLGGETKTPWDWLKRCQIVMELSSPKHDADIHTLIKSW